MTTLRSLVALPALICSIAFAAPAAVPAAGTFPNIPGRANATPSIAAAGSVVAVAWGASAKGKADVVFVDAPCSGIGALRRNPEARWRLREADISSFATRQREIMRAALDLAAPGARVVYATCSLLTAENEQVAQSLEGALPVPLGEVLGPQRAPALSREGAFTVAPHVHGTDGFYARVMKRL